VRAPEVAAQHPQADEVVKGYVSTLADVLKDKVRDIDPV
jgi:hypothetical protein